MEVSPQGGPTAKDMSRQSDDNAENNQAGNAGAVDALIAVVKEVTAVKHQLAEMKQEVKDQQSNTEDLRLEVRNLGRGMSPIPGPASNSGVPSRELKKMDLDLASGSADHDHGPHVEQSGIVRGGQEVYTFQESVWDSLIFLGFIQGSYEGIDMIILGFINLSIQIFFCALLVTLDMANTTEEVYTEQVNDFIQWRIGVAHQAEHYDPLTNSSLAQRVCLKYGGTIESRRHANDLRVAAKYYDVSKKGGSELQGPGLLMLALALWLALILKEVVGILGFTRMLAALTLNGHGKTDLHPHPENGDELEITSLSKLRASILFVTVVLPRLFIASMLGYVGIFYLRQTFSVEEIILNAMALGFVLEIDELLFHFLPAAARYATTHIAAVSLEIIDESNKMHTHNKGASSIRKLIGAIFERTRILLVILVVVVIYFRFTIIAAIQDSMEISQLILCEGNRDFIFKENRATKVLHVARTVDKSNEDKMNLPVDEIQDVFDSILQATGLCGQLDEKKSLQDRLELCNGENKGVWCDRCDYLRGLGPDDHLWKSASLDLTVSLVTATRNEALSGLSCTDRYTTYNETHIPAPMNELLRLAGANFSATLCQGMDEYCNYPDPSIKEVVRIFCPNQCQCDHGTSATMDKWFFDRTGCAPACQTLVDSELTQLEDDLILGKETCVDRDSKLTERQWRTYVEDVQEEFVKRGWLIKVEGRYYASDSVLGFFAVKTRLDMRDFSVSVLHSSNRPTVTIGGCNLPEASPIDLVEWARQAGSLCRWVRIVKYVFGLNLCSHSILLSDGFYGFNSLEGLCPLSCGIGSCSQIKPDGDMNGNLNAWYNVMPWGHDAYYNIDCDRDKLVCLEVEKFAREWRSWPDDWTISITTDTANVTEVYSASLQTEWHPDYGLIAYEKDVVCMRPENTTSSCYLIETTPEPFNWYNHGGMRWRLTEVGSGQLLVMGSHGETHRACGLNWLTELGVECNHGDSISVMTSWHQMQVDAEFIRAGTTQVDIPEDPASFWLMGLVDGIFAWRKALVQGGYDGESVNILYEYILIGATDTLPLAKLAKPTTKKEGAGQGFAGCLPAADLHELRQDRKLCKGWEDGGLLCSQFVSQVECGTPLGFIRDWFIASDCESDLDGYSDYDTVEELCPESCIAQAACDLGASTGYASYYSFQPAGCLDKECACMDPWDVIRLCWSEANLTRNWWDLDYSSSYDDYGDFYYGGYGGPPTTTTTTTTSTIPHGERETMGSLMKDGSMCASEATGFPSRTAFIGNLTEWCYVKPTCTGSKKTQAHPEHCGWRPASTRECALSKPEPQFCISGPGPHNCYSFGGSGFGGPGGGYYGDPYGGYYYR